MAVEVQETFGGGKGQNILSIPESFVHVKVSGWQMPRGGLWHSKPISKALETVLLASFKGKGLAAARL